MIADEHVCRCCAEQQPQSLVSLSEDRSKTFLSVKPMGERQVCHCLILVSAKAHGARTERDILGRWFCCSVHTYRVRMARKLLPRSINSPVVQPQSYWIITPCQCIFLLLPYRCSVLSRDHCIACTCRIVMHYSSGASQRLAQLKVHCMALRLCATCHVHSPSISRFNAGSVEQLFSRQEASATWIMCAKKGSS